MNLSLTEWEAVLDIIDRWQTLITGILALIAACLTIIVLLCHARLLQNQISLQRDNDIALLHRRELATRALLPDSISAISEYAIQCARYVDRYGRNANNIVPELPIEAIRDVKLSIEFANESMRGRIMNLINHFQVHNSRLRNARLERPLEREERLYDAVLLKCLADDLFEYARGDEEQWRNVRSSRQDMTTALHIAVGINEFYSNQAAYNAVCELINRRHQEDSDSA